MGHKLKLSAADLRVIEDIVEKQVDRIVEQKMTAFRAQASASSPSPGLGTRWPGSEPAGPPVLDGEAYCRNAAELARALGLPRDDIRVIRLYSRNDPGPSPFNGWGAYPSKVRQWLQERANVPALSRMLRRLAPRNRAAGPAIVP